MSLIPNEWSVVVAGRWNRAILTPAGIRERVFQLDEETPLEVLVPIDLLAPFQVTHDGITVAVFNSRMVISVATMTFEKLFEAQEKAINAINSLPETPFVAAGINVGYSDSDELPELDEILETQGLDAGLADNGLEICGRTIGRQLVWRQGRVNLTIARGEDDIRMIKLNIERKSATNEDLVDWLQTSADDISGLSRSVVNEVLNLELDEND